MHPTVFWYAVAVTLWIITFGIANCINIPTRPPNHPIRENNTHNSRIHNKLFISIPFHLGSPHDHILNWPVFVCLINKRHRTMNVFFFIFCFFFKARKSFGIVNNLWLKERFSCCSSISCGSRKWTKKPILLQTADDACQLLLLFGSRNNKTETAIRIMHRDSNKGGGRQQGGIYDKPFWVVFNDTI